MLYTCINRIRFIFCLGKISEAIGNVSEMDTFQDLKKHYATFKKTVKHIQRKKFSVLDLTKLETSLNAAQPIDSREKAWKRLILALGGTDANFVDYLHKNKPYLTLWLDAKTITKLYTLDNKLHIHWTGAKYQIFIHRDYIL